MKTLRQRVACKALITHGSKILIIREATTYKDGTNIGKYHLPGGRIEPGEPLVDGLRREVLEETGLQVAIGPAFFASEWFPVIRGEPNHIVAIFFVCTARGQAVTLSDEHDDSRWIAPSDYQKYPIMPPEDEVLRAYLAMIDA